MTPKTLQYLDKYLRRDHGSVLEVGSGDVNGGVKDFLMARGHNYYGVDIEPGPNVDQVIPHSSAWSLGSKYDYIICVNTLEHVEQPWILIPTMAAHLVQGGRMILVAPFSFQYHRHPVDCWRFTPDSMESLATDANLTLLVSFLDYEASATYGALSDIFWLASRRRFREALAKIPEWWTRPPSWNCVGVMLK